MLSGLWMAITYVFFGILACILIVTIPFGIASFRIAAYALWPFGRTVIRREHAGVASAVGNLIWPTVAGIWLAPGHIPTGALLCITIIGLPVGAPPTVRSRVRTTGRPGTDRTCVQPEHAVRP